MRAPRGGATVGRTSASVELKLAESERNMSERNMPPARKRIDTLLVERGLFESRARARAAIEAGLVTADDRQGIKTSQSGAPAALVPAEPPPPFLSRRRGHPSGPPGPYP